MTAPAPEDSDTRVRAEARVVEAADRDAEDAEDDCLVSPALPLPTPGVLVPPAAFVVRALGAGQSGLASSDTWLEEA